MEAYSQSKLALVMFTFDLAEALKGEQLTVNCLHPASLMNTKMVYEWFGSPQSTLEEGQSAVMYLTTSPNRATSTGRGKQLMEPWAKRVLVAIWSVLTRLTVVREAASEVCWLRPGEGLLLW